MLKIKRIRKIILVIGFLAMSTTMAFASGAPYVGAALGMNTMTSTSGSNTRSVPIDLFAGYGATLNASFYLAGEVTLTPFTGLLSKSPGSPLKTTYGYGMSILPGIMFSDHALGYIRAGVVKSHFSAIGGNKTGGQLGIGIQATITQDIDLRSEYVYTQYSKITTASSPKSDAFKLGLIYKFE